jgi:type 1 glutamine amidotransferase
VKNYFLRHLVFFFATCLVLVAADIPAKKKVLIITGDDVRVHDWVTTVAATREILNETKQFDVNVVGTPSVLDDAKRLSGVSVVFLLMANVQTPTLSDVGKANLLAYVKAGGGFVAQHYASSSFKEWPEFRELCGRVWVAKTSGHGPRSTFAVQIVDRAHAITQGVPDFTADDELYSKLQGDAPIHVLAQAQSDWSKQTEPLAFIRSYGKGRVFQHEFGHDVKSLSIPAVRILIARGTIWAAGL